MVRWCLSKYLVTYYLSIPLYSLAFFRFINIYCGDVVVVQRRKSVGSLLGGNLDDVFRFLAGYGDNVVLLVTSIVIMV